ncbi:thiamine pyrophosphate-binding protein [Streptomyces pseudoechinosporeus]
MTSPPRHPTGWHAVVDELLTGGHDTLYGLPADDLGLLRAVEPTPLRFVLCRDQRNAVFMAVGHALATGRPGLCAVGKGPALASAVPGLVEAHAGRVPLVLLATGTARDRTGTGAFQELDQLALVRSVTKWAMRVESPDRVADALRQALAVAGHGRPGPVFLELPEDVAAAPAPGATARPAFPRQVPRPAPEVLGAAAEWLRDAERPLILVGGGMRHRNASGEVEQLAERLGAPLFTTASGRGAVREDHPLHCGLAGLYTPEPARELWADCDLVLALGSRLEETATFGWERRQDCAVIQVNTAEQDLATAWPGLLVLGDGGAAVGHWLDDIGPEGAEPDARSGDDTGWRRRAERARAAALARAETAALFAGPADGRPPRVVEVLATLREVLPEDVLLVQENGLQDMWSYHFPYWTVGRPGGSIVPSEQTSLGFAGGAAAGARTALQDRPVAALMGDGAFNLFRSDLETVAEQCPAVLYVVLDNGGYGWLQHQLRATGPVLADGDASRFSFARPRADGAGAGAVGGNDGPGEPSGALLVHADQQGQLRPALEKAWQSCLSGHTAVVVVRVGLEDVPPGLDAPGGDFPERNADSHADSHARPHPGS